MASGINKMFVKDYDALIKPVVDDCIKNLTQEQKEQFNDMTPLSEHFGYGMHIRNKYIYDEETRIERYNEIFEPDDFSAEVIKRMKFYLGGGLVESTTVGELRKMLEQYPDDIQVVLEIGNYSDMEMFETNQTISAEQTTGVHGNSQLVLFDAARSKGGKI